MTGRFASIRVDAVVLHRIAALARRLRVSKKRVIEDAVQACAARLDEEQYSDVLIWRPRSNRARSGTTTRTSRRRLTPH